MVVGLDDSLSASWLSECLPVSSTAASLLLCIIVKRFLDCVEITCMDVMPEKQTVLEARLCFASANVKIMFYFLFCFGPKYTFFFISKERFCREGQS